MAVKQQTKAEKQERDWKQRCKDAEEIRVSMGILRNFISKCSSAGSVATSEAVKLQDFVQDNRGQMESFLKRIEDRFAEPYQRTKRKS